MVYNDSYDDFWDVSKLVPKKKSVSKPFSTTPKTADVVIDEPRGDKNAEAVDGKLNFDAYRAEASSPVESSARSYIPKGMRLITRVTIKPSIDRFDFYDTFRKAALIYYDYKCPKCEFTPFYSYKPQYSQMTTAQKKYYFYWRDELRRGNYIKTDYSYVYLYAYEILNLPDKISGEAGLSMLCDVWCAYRRDLPRIDVNFSAWVQDYCLVWELECPFDKIRHFLFDILNVSAFKEFYLSEKEGAAACSAMLAYLSDYDWRRGKYASGENAEMYRSHLEAAMQRVLRVLLSDDAAVGSEISKLSRAAFPGSLCTHSVKCNLEIEYYAISNSPKLRSAVTAALKYTENKLRALIGVKSRLAVKDLPDVLRGIIDKYFASAIENARRARERANAPEYERLYDAPDSERELSFADAIEIERASWKTTARLVEGSEEYAEDDACEPQGEQTVPSGADEREVSDDKYGLSEAELAFLRAALVADAEEEKRICRECGVLPDSMADRINEAFFDNFGDVVLESAEEGFEVIEDYYEEITKWLK